MEVPLVKSYNSHNRKMISIITLSQIVIKKNRFLLFLLSGSLFLPSEEIFLDAKVYNLVKKNVRSFGLLFIQQANTL
jgi:hypothetical protein